MQLPEAQQRDLNPQPSDLRRYAYLSYAKKEGF